MSTDDDYRDRAAVAAITALAEHNIPADVQELLIYGNPAMGVRPGALSKAVKAVLVEYGVTLMGQCTDD